MNNKKMMVQKMRVVSLSFILLINSTMFVIKYYKIEERFQQWF